MSWWPNTQPRAVPLCCANSSARMAMPTILHSCTNSSSPTTPKPTSALSDCSSQSFSKCAMRTSKCCLPMSQTQCSSVSNWNHLRLFTIANSSEKQQLQKTMDLVCKKYFLKFKFIFSFKKSICLLSNRCSGFDSKSEPHFWCIEEKFTIYGGKYLSVHCIPKRIG